MENNGSNTLNDKDGGKKQKKLPPLLDQNPKSMIKKQSGISELDLISNKAG